MSKIQIFRMGLMIASGNNQDFLGFRWIERLLASTPENAKRPIALRILDLSPHYFYRTEANRELSRRRYLESEYRRNMASREVMVEDIVRPHLTGVERVVDYGCGPGFLARAAVRYARQVWACDIARGVLACARAINGAPNVQYCLLDGRGVPVQDGTVDLIYTFAVIQHVTDEVFERILSDWYRLLRPGGKVLCHVVLNGKGWRDEAGWRHNNSLRGRLKWKFGLHCFSRTEESLIRLVTAAGLSFISTHLISDFSSRLKDDVASQNLCILEKPVH